MPLAADDDDMLEPDADDAENDALGYLSAGSPTTYDSLEGLEDGGSDVRSDEECSASLCSHEHVPSSVIMQIPVTKCMFLWRSLSMRRPVLAPVPATTTKKSKRSWHLQRKSIGARSPLSTRTQTMLSRYSGRNSHGAKLVRSSKSTLPQLVRSLS